LKVAADLRRRWGKRNERPNLLRETFTLQGMTQVQASMAGRMADSALRREERSELNGRGHVRDLLLDADFDGPLGITKKRQHGEYRGTT